MKYSIITSVYNCAKHISKLMASIFNQSYPNIEWVVQDGGSTDGTLNILRPYADRIKLISEPDSGIYDAWNKALDRATGDWAIFLGADDFLVSRHSIAQCHRYLRTAPAHISMSYGALLTGKNGKVGHMINRSMQEVYNLFLSRMGLPFPATFIRMSVLQKERFDVSYKIAGDFDFAAKILTSDNIIKLPIIVSYMELGGVSDDPKSCVLFEERLRVLFSRVAPKAREIMEASLNYALDEDNPLEDIP
ncbi:glycosyltransferase family 2 protein [Desulfovibrio legallii]|uniref:Glycosyl transferase family 2 n=1 Tax=Desulfovibrio legallii TaxID=571438 RepID=A0A1G7NNY8_9BACT|nr:glycosyltransferase family 2 protein [Desulfovibrio legallii]SDF75009.1 Glycosyl transferase family 2 [Desulfovibrio legallii]